MGPGILKFAFPGTCYLQHSKFIPCSHVMREQNSLKCRRSGMVRRAASWKAWLACIFKSREARQHPLVPLCCCKRRDQGQTSSRGGLLARRTRRRRQTHPELERARQRCRRPEAADFSCLLTRRSVGACRTVEPAIELRLFDACLGGLVMKEHGGGKDKSLPPRERLGKEFGTCCTLQARERNAPRSLSANAAVQAAREAGGMSRARQRAKCWTNRAAAHC